MLERGGEREEVEAEGGERDASTKGRKRRRGETVDLASRFPLCSRSCANFFESMRLD